MAQTSPRRSRRRTPPPRAPYWPARRLYLTGGIVAAIVVAVILWALFGRGGGGTTATGASGATFLAPAPSYSGHPTIDGIPCETTERVAYHVHSHLAIFVNGRPAGVPDGIGIAAPRQEQNSAEGAFVTAGGCFYWLHTHTPDGVIHIESPSEQPFTLGQFFDVWQTPLRANQVGPDQGTVIAYLNGQRFSGDPRQIPLGAHNVIQLDLGQDTPPAAYTFPQGL